MSLHRIRLQGPWEWTTSASREPQRVKLPDEWGTLPVWNAEVQFIRRFHRPTGITSQDQLYISIPTRGLVIHLHLNQMRLEIDQSTGLVRANVTRPLNEHNELVVTFSAIDPARPDQGLGEPVGLEIVTPDLE
ncbi:MAG: hypothetical protein DWH91_10385 [Planctomycetota bacterium]|nr:MAG: hypothetical protein DWH91_10385 [Planctomycetota bacterium]